MDKLEINNIDSMFNVLSMSEMLNMAIQKPVPRDLYYSLVFEGEVTVLFAETNVGKSVFAMQMADHISRMMPVLYIDMELTDMQVLGRYVDDEGNIYKFNDNLQIAHYSDEDETIIEGKYEDNFVAYLERYIERYDREHICIVVDNMTMIYTGDMNKAKDVTPLMKKIKNIAKRTGTTFILIEHTKKTENFIPMSLNQIMGSKMKSIPVDSLVAIARSSQGEDIRYVRRLKDRCSIKLYTEDSAAIYRLEKTGSFLGFTYLGTDSEYNHLVKALKVNKTERNAEIIRLHEQGMPNTKIAEEISLKYGESISEGAVRKIIKQSE